MMTRPCWFAPLNVWLLALSAYSQQRYVELLSEIEQWGLYDPYVGEVSLYLLVIVPLSYWGQEQSWGSRLLRRWHPGAEVRDPS
ncbi:MAG: hypothetical protein OHK0012_22570 [Synechococcales cyanobacterium]